MHSPNQITTSKKFIAWVLIFSQLLTSCINFNLPSKQELTDLETTKRNKQRSNLESSKSYSSITKHTRELSEISLIPLADDDGK